MMARKLAKAVYVSRSDGTVGSYLPGDSPSAADAKLITNDDAWESASSAKSDTKD